MPPKSGLRARSSTAPSEVFLNLPYDAAFERLYLAYIVGVSALGMVPRATLELPGAIRIDRIWTLISGCRYSIHDLSRVQLDRTPPFTAPRFNMPFELGLATAFRIEHPGEHEWFVYESRNRRVMKSLSDLNGTDVYIHDGTIRGVFAQLCNAFVRGEVQPSVPQMERIYRELRRAIPSIKRHAGANSLYGARAFKDLSVAASALADKVILGQG
jgi:hypothetical protein